MAKVSKIGNESFVVAPTDDDVVSDNSQVERDVVFAVNFLKSEGFRPEVKKSGSVYFKFEGHHIYFQANPNDREQFCLFIPNIWPIEPSDRDLAVQTANFVCEKFVGVKAVYLECNEVWIAYEGYAENIAGFTAIINRVVERLQYGARQFIDVFNETKRSKVHN